MLRSKSFALLVIPLICGAGFWLVRAQEPPEPKDSTDAIEDADCVFFSGKLKNRVRSGPRRVPSSEQSLTAVTSDVTRRIGGGASREDDGMGVRPSYVPGNSRTGTSDEFEAMGPVDRMLFSAMRDVGATPAERTNDFEFARRVTLDLTGRVPTPARLLAFVADTSPGKRAQLIDELLAKSEWVDRWTMYFGDLYANNSRNTQVTRYDQGRNAFYKWIRDSLASGKPYDQMARELIAAQGTDSFAAGNINFLIGGIVTGGPQQDIWDQQTANISETFLGIAHTNCLLCHNGRGHLDALSLWGKSTQRTTAWGMSSFLSRTMQTRTEVSAQPQVYSWSLVDGGPRTRTDYPLNTTTGNRPARQPGAGPANVAPVYPFSGRGPAAGENYRIALAREVTADPQFSRAIVNYIWKEFFGRGFVEPANQFDPARLDPDNPPPAPWTLQPSNPRLLNWLAADFAANGFDLKRLMRQIAGSQAYQLSARYSGNFDPSWEPLFARKFVRRLWAEEIHDAVAQTSGMVPAYNIRGFSDQGFGPVQWAMRFPDTVNTPDGGGAVSQFLNSFLRGNRDDEDRRADGSVLQGLNLMNDNFVMSRIRSTSASGTPSLLQSALAQPDPDLVNTLYLTVLSRYPSADERAARLQSLASGSRVQKGEDLLWALYNKVDFIFNY